MNHHIKLTATGMDSFTGQYGAYYFVDGVSVEALPRSIIDRLGSIVPVQILDEEGEEVGQAGTAARTVLATDMPIPVVENLRKMTEAERDAETQQTIMQREAAPGTKIYTKEELQKIADAEGINGLRSIANLWKVKDRSINKLIFEILKAQSVWLARAAEKNAEQILAKEAAADEARKQHEARELLISSSARNLSAENEEKRRQEIQGAAQVIVDRDKTIAEAAKVIADAAAKALADAEPDETPNAVDEGGNSVYVAPAEDPEFEEPNNPSDEK